MARLNLDSVGRSWLQVEVGCGWLVLLFCTGTCLLAGKDAFKVLFPQIIPQRKDEEGKRCGDDEEKPPLGGHSDVKGAFGINIRIEEDRAEDGLCVA